MLKFNLLSLSLFLALALTTQNQLISPFAGDITPNQPATNFLMQKPTAQELVLGQTQMYSIQ